MYISRKYIVHPVRSKDIRQKTVHRQELRGCGDLFIWFGGPLHKRFQGPLVCCLLLPKLQTAIGYYNDQTQFLLASTEIRPVSNLLLSTFGPQEKSVLLKCRHPHCVALSFYLMSLVRFCIRLVIYVAKLAQLDQETITFFAGFLRRDL